MKRKVVLFIPGLMNPPSMWDAVIGQLEQSIEARVVDLSSQVSISTMAKDAWQLVQDLDEEDDLLLCGFSMGSYVVLDMISHPIQKINAAMLIGTSLQTETEQSAEIRKKSMAAIEKDFLSFLNQLTPFLVSEKFAQQEAQMTLMKEKMYGMGSAVALRQNNAIAQRTVERQILAQSDIPVIVLCGAEDRVSPPSRSQEVAELLASEQALIIEGVGHMVPLEDPTTIAKQINKYF